MNRRKPIENLGNINNGKTRKTTRGAATHRTRNSTKSIRRTARRKGLPFYALMKKLDKKFEWTEVAYAAFSQLKKVLSTPPVLVAPKEREPLLLYIAAPHQVVSTVLVAKQSEEGRTLSSDQYTSSAKFYHRQNSTIHIIKNLRTTCSQQHRNYGSILRFTQS
jgi:hypothetical protein